MELSIAVRCRGSKPIYSARLRKFFRHFWLDFSKGSFGQLTTFPEDLFISPGWKSLILRPRERETNTVDPGTLTSPVIGHVTAGLLSVTASTFRRVLEGGGGTWGSSKKGKVFNAKALWYPNLFLFCFVFWYCLSVRSLVCGKNCFYCRWHFGKAVITRRFPLYCLEPSPPTGIQEEVITALTKACFENQRCSLQLFCCSISAPVCTKELAWA